MSTQETAQTTQAAGNDARRGMDEPRRSFMEDYYSLALRLDKVYAKLARCHGETYYSLWAIDEIGRAEGGLTQKELAALLMAPKQTVNSIVGSLERRGLVKTLPSPTDKRSKVHTLTDVGRELFNEADADQVAADALCMKRVGSSRISDMLETMECILDCIEEAYDESDKQ